MKDKLILVLIVFVIIGMITAMGYSMREKPHCAAIFNCPSDKALYNKEYKQCLVEESKHNSFIGDMQGCDMWVKKKICDIVPAFRYRFLGIDTSHIIPCSKATTRKEKHICFGGK